MKALITGSCGLIGSEAARFYLAQGWEVVGVDNDARRRFFGDDASTLPVRAQLEAIPGYTHIAADIRGMQRAFADHGPFALIAHAAAQPSHDWARDHVLEDFTTNAWGTVFLLDQAHRHCPEAPFVFLSTNKVYGDAPNRLPTVELATRYALKPPHEHGISEQMSIDASLHSFFGCSKAAADLYVQEYAQTFGMRTACFRCGCLTGPAHRGAELHGFLSYLVHCVVTGKPYTIYGYGGKQVRDQLHAADLVAAIECFRARPIHGGPVYNLGGGPGNSISVLEAIGRAEKLAGKHLDFTLDPTPRLGDHRCYYSDTTQFECYYDWHVEHRIHDILAEMVAAEQERAPC